ncbi:MAG: 4-hydroxybenzoate octaprenyltransferase, partial [Gammaproteobacteria bacterium]|nr:4-hydroxybenzoate octaprenyltransferase [Gammaproteobacteria bacterium]
LTRLDRPIGIYLLLWPTITALWIAAEGFPGIALFLIFTLGTAIMRSAGCCVNDFADYRIDGQVLRTEKRPIPSGMLRRRDAFLCFGVLSGVGFLLVLLTNRETVFLSIGAIAIIAVYPFMKRFTNLPQLVLGVAFSWGILMAFTAVTTEIPQAAYLLFIANALWTIAYDTQYAMVDREFDMQIGVKSTAILFGDADRLMIGMLQAMFIISLVLAARQLQMGTVFYFSLVAASGLLAYQQFLIRHRLPGPCFKAFLNNNWVGAIIFVGTFLNYL